MAALKPDGSAKECEVCHTLHDWKEITGFDHSTTTFALEGSHRSVTCEACHKAPNLQVGLKNVSFKSAPTVCSGCHEDAHGGQFAKEGAVDCARCHRLFKWKSTTFNHDTDTSFRLAGAHRNVRCGKCHMTSREVAGKKVIFYKPTPRDCIACHGGQEIGGK